MALWRKTDFCLTREEAEYCAAHVIDTAWRIKRQQVFAPSGDVYPDKTKWFYQIMRWHKKLKRELCYNRDLLAKSKKNFRLWLSFCCARSLYYLPQDFGVYPDFSIQDYLMYIAALKGIRPAVAKRRVQDALLRVGLSKARNKKMKTLSGGMKRRTGIAQAMLNDPKILIGRVLPTLGVCMALYLLLSILLIPMMYREYRRKRL